MKNTKRHKLLACTSIVATAMNIVAPAAFAAAPLDIRDRATTTPIEHVIVIYGENRTFDHLFGTFVPKHGQTVRNLISEGIVNADGTPGPSFNKARQYKATDTTTYTISPTKTSPYAYLPPPSTGGTPTAPSDAGAPFKTLAEAETYDTGLLPQDLKLLLQGASGLPKGARDTRIANVTTLPNGPYQLTTGTMTYHSYAGSPVHRFYQGWQGSDCSASYATPANPSGCLNDLYPWVEETVAAGSNGKPPKTGFSSTGEGAISMGFYNVQTGDQPFFTQLARQYAISDNYHMPAQGGTGLNSIFAGFADAIWFSDGMGKAATPPADQIENPNPQSGTNNYYTQDGYSGGSYSACADMSQPGVPAVVNYLGTLKPKISSNCAAGHYYLLNNYNPGYYGNGQVNADPTDIFKIPPTSQRSIGDLLLDSHVSFRWYGEGWNQYAANPTDPTDVYCNICNPFLYQTKIMTNSTIRNKVLKDTSDFYNDVENGILPAVSFVKPGGLNDGHPTSSKWDIFEAFTKKILSELRENPKLWASTAVFITDDEGGGYWDSGYIQPVDFFGDGPRIPLIVVSPYSVGGTVSHHYADHISILKFIEANWGLGHITTRSRDNLPNPVARTRNPYVPVNSPAISDLMDMFDFD